MPLPTLKTERLTLRPLLLSDTQPIFALRSDPEVNKYLDRIPSKTMEDARTFIHNAIEHAWIYWAITLTASERLVGTICLFGFSDKHPNCEIGYELLTSFQGKGIMKEAASKVVEYATQTLKVQTIEAFTHKDNQPSAKLLAQLAFKKSMEQDEANPDCELFTFCTAIPGLPKNA